MSDNPLRAPSSSNNPLRAPSVTPSTPVGPGGGGGGGARDDSMTRLVNALSQDPEFVRIRTLQQQLFDLQVDPASQEQRDIFGQSTTTNIVNEIEDLTAVLVSKYTDLGATPEIIGQLTVYSQGERDIPFNASDRAVQQAAATAGRATIAGVDVLEGVVEPLQQVLFRGINAAITSRNRGESTLETIRAIAASPGEIEWGKIFGPGFQEDALRFGDILREAGMKNETAVRAFGLVGDIFFDPLMAGGYLAGIGRLGKMTGAVRGGAQLIEQGRALERALSPVGAGQGLRWTARQVAPDVTRAVERRFTGVLNTLFEGFNTTVPGYRRARGEKSVGEFLFPRGAVPGTTGDAIRGGTGRPEEFLAYESIGDLEADELLDWVNRNLEDLNAMWGADRTKGLLRAAQDAVRSDEVALARTMWMPENVRGTVQTLAFESADNTSPLFLDEVLENLDEYRVRRRPGEEIPAGETIGEELRFLQGETPDRSPLILERNAERVREVAERNGVDPAQAEATYRKLVNTLVENDTVAAWHATGYVPMQQRFWELVADIGGSPEDARRLWGAAYQLGAMGEDPGALTVDVVRYVEDALTGDQREFMTRYIERLEIANAALGRVDEVGQSEVERLFGEANAMFMTREGIEVEQVLRSAASEVVDETPTAAAEAAQRILLGRMFTGLGTSQFPIRKWFQALPNGHLRRVYGLHTGDWNQYLKQLEAGNITPNRFLEDALEEGIEGLSDNVQGLIREYLGDISPSIPGERGFLVRTSNILKFLSDRGVPVNEIQDAVIGMVRGINTDDSASDLIRRLRDRMQPKETGPGAPPSGVGTGASFFAPRQVGLTEQQRAAFLRLGLEVPEELPSEIAQEGAFAGERVLSEEGVRGISNELLEATDPRTGELLFRPGTPVSDARELAELGRLFEVNIPSRETARAVSGRYPAQRMVQDIYGFAKENGAVYAQREFNEAPDNFVLIKDAQYGPFQNTRVHPWVARELRNALKAQPSNSLATFSLIRGTLQGGFLASPRTTFVNTIGGVMSASLAGENALEFTGEFINTLARATRAGGIEKLPGYRDIEDLFRSGVLRSQFIRQLDADRLEAIAAQPSVTDRLLQFVEYIGEVNERPGRILGAPAAGLRAVGAERAAEAFSRLGEAGGRATRLLGLEAFQLSEDIMKFAGYNLELARSGNVVEAYKHARNIVFDYSSLPESVAILRDLGVVMFPGFSTFMTQRIFETAAKTPGRLAPWVRAPEAVWNAVIPEEEVRNAFFATMEAAYPWMVDEAYVPFALRGARGSFIPANQITPIAPWKGNTLTDSLLNGGIYQGIFDFFRGLSGGTGVAPFSQRFGRRVFGAENIALQSDTPEQQRESQVGRYTQAAQFLVNSYAPAWFRSLYQAPEGRGEARGIISDIGALLQRNGFMTSNPEATQFLQRLDEMNRGRPDRDLMEQTVTALFRSAQPISLDPTINPVVQGLTSEDFLEDEVLQALGQEVSRIMLDPNVDPERKKQKVRELIQRQLDISGAQLDRVTTVLAGFARLQRRQGVQQNPLRY